MMKILKNNKWEVLCDLEYELEPLEVLDDDPKVITFKSCSTSPGFVVFDSNQYACHKYDIKAGKW